MSNATSVITLLDRFTISADGGTSGGDVPVYSPWVRLPLSCRSTEVVYECFIFNGSGSVDMSLESSMDQVETDEVAGESITTTTVVRVNLKSGLGRYARAKLTPQGTVPVNMVLSAYLILRTAE